MLAGFRSFIVDDFIENILQIIFGDYRAVLAQRKIPIVYRPMIANRAIGKHHKNLGSKFRIQGFFQEFFRVQNGDEFHSVIMHVIINLILGINTVVEDSIKRNSLAAVAIHELVHGQGIILTDGTFGRKEHKNSGLFILDFCQ